MSRRGDCWDKALAESFFSSLKKERIRKRVYKTRDLARSDLFNYIEAFYNRAHRNSHMGGVQMTSSPPPAPLRRTSSPKRFKQQLFSNQSLADWRAACRL